MLTRRLATLTAEGLLEKRRYSERPPREEYLLTAAGRDFLPVLFMIGAWGRQYRDSPNARCRTSPKWKQNDRLGYTGACGSS